MEAFEALYRAFQPQLLRYLRIREAQAEDLAADTWVSVITHVGTFSGDDAAFRGWLFTIARHRAIDAGRANARRPVDLVGDDTSVLDRPTADAADSAMEHLSTEAAMALIRELPDDQAEAVSLRFIAGLAVGQVAELMDRTPGAVRVLTHRGLRTLGRRLGGQV